jgi:hypothetical protein
LEGATLGKVPLAHQYVRYVAAAHESLVELLTDWQPWCPELTWSDMAVHVPVLAAAITELAERGHIELFYGPRDGEIARAAADDVPRIVNDPASWWNDESTPQTELRLTASAGPVAIPERRPDVYQCRQAPDLQGFRIYPRYLADVATLAGNAVLPSAEVGRRSKELTESEEAISLLRQRVATDRDAHLLDLAGTLDNYAVQLAGLGRPGEALGISQEALTLFRELASAARETHILLLATALWIFAQVRLGLSIERVKAIDAAREAESIFSELAATRPEAFSDELRAVQQLHRYLIDEPTA